MHMPTSSSSSVGTATQSSAQHDRGARPVDERVLQLLEDHRPWEALDDVVLAIIDRTYAALLEILRLVVAPPAAGGGPVKVRQLVYATDPDSPVTTSPIPCVVEASATHCSISLVDGGFEGGSGWCEYTNSIYRLMRTWPHLQERRASVSTWPSMLRLARADGGGEGVQGGHGSTKCAADDRPDVVSDEGFLRVLDIRPGVCEEGLLRVLDMVRSHLGRAIKVETSLIRMARTNGCMRPHKVKEIFTVRMVLERMRREVDLRAIMRMSCIQYRRLLRAREISRRRHADEMDVDQVDEAEVLTKRLKAMHV